MIMNMIFYFIRLPANFVIFSQWEHWLIMFITKYDKMIKDVIYDAAIRKASNLTKN